MLAAPSSSLLPRLQISLSVPSTAMSSFPLVCKICPKHPNFSDISHLLTHVGSKGHLSHHHKAQVRSSHDNSALRQLQDYDAWYENNKIEKLLAQRLASKDAKVTNLKMRQSSTPSLVTAGRKRKSTEPAVVRPMETVADSDDATLIDPQIASIGQAARISSPGHISPNPKRHKLPLRPTHLPPSVHAQQEIFRETRGTNDYMQYKEGNDAFDMPNKRCLIPNGGTENIQDHQDIENVPLEDRKSTSDQACCLQSRSLTSNSRQAHGQHLVKEEEELDLIPLVKLKGPQWPGMALFDSASPETQRKRNQKKEGAVLGQMEQDSRGVQQIETIYFPDGSLKKERVITGIVESSSPVRLQSPKPKRRRGRRAALAEIDGNVPRTGKVTGSTKSAANVRNGRSTIWAGVSSPHRPFHRQMQTFEDDIFGTFNETEAEWVLNMGVSEYNSRRKMAVFREGTVSQGAKGHEERQGTQPNTNPPTEASPVKLLGRNNHTIGLSPRAFESISHGGDPSHQTPDLTDLADVRSARTTETFRGRAVAPMLARKRSDDAMIAPVDNPRITQRYFSTSANGGPHIFHQVPSEMDFGQFELPSFHGQIINPLNRNVLHQQTHFYQSFPAAQVSLSARLHEIQGSPKST